MSISLREGETIRCQTNLHPMFYRVALGWAAFLTFILVLGYFASKDPNNSFGRVIFLDVLFGWLPFSVAYLRFKTTKYYVTNLRIYLSAGIVTRNIRDIPLAKVNDVEFSQGILDRLNKTGKLRVLTGNDKGTLIKDIENPEQFREAITSIIGQTNAKSA